MNQPINPQIGPMTKIQADHQHTIQRLANLGKAACEEIQRFHPDLVIVLAHGGWAALWAAEVVWAETSSEPFPKALVTNMGREKIRRYTKVRSTVPCAEINPFVVDYAGCFEIGYFLAWLSKQTDWHDALRRQVLQALDGKAPKRLLVLDDTTWEGGTYRLALSLLCETFPDCEVHMVAGNLLEWRVNMGALWLQERRPGTEVLLSQEVRSWLYEITPGTADAGNGEDSFDWRPITLDDQTVQRLSRFLPAEEWLAYPKWAEQSIREGVAKCVRANDVFHEQEGLPQFSIHSYERIIKHLWLYGSINWPEAADLLKVNLQEGW